MFQAICLFLSSACIFVCIFGSTFPAIHANKIQSYYKCNMTNRACRCFQSSLSKSRVFTYNDVDSCEVIFCIVNLFLILESVLNAMGSGVSFWFVILLWKEKYDNFYSGLKFYSYSASVPPHP